MTVEERRAQRKLTTDTWPLQADCYKMEMMNRFLFNYNKEYPMEEEAFYRQAIVEMAEYYNSEVVGEFQ